MKFWNINEDFNIFDEDYFKRDSLCLFMCIFVDI
jgi:hypothetical protein